MSTGPLSSRQWIEPGINKKIMRIFSDGHDDNEDDNEHEDDEAFCDRCYF